jgi:hypothetical protein
MQYRRGLKSSRSRQISIRGDDLVARILPNHPQALSLKRERHIRPNPEMWRILHILNRGANA